MDNSRFWHLGLAPGTPMDDMQARLEQLYEAEANSVVPQPEDEDHDGNDTTE